MALSREDTEAVESPLVLSVARQLDNGPRGLYGPYGGRYPLVLIHAPLYYRLAALAAWPLHRAGLDSVSAALAAGRVLSGFGFLATVAAAYRLGRLGGMPKIAGWWAALLVAATPVYGGLQFEVRPDMLGIALQTTGILLVLAALATEPIATSKLILAFGCFALASCIKQHFVVAPLVSLLLMFGAQARGRLDLASIARCVLIASAVVFCCYATDEWMTEGRMSQSVFVAARYVGRVHPADWYFALNTFLALIWKCVGLILLLAAAGLAIVSSRPGRGRRTFAAVGTPLIVLVAALAALQLVLVQMWVSRLILLGLLLVIGLVIPACVLWERSLVAGWLGLVLCAYWVGELGLAALLWRQSTGGWFNYALESVVIACVVTGRALARACNDTTCWRPLIPAVVAAVAVPAFAFTDVKEVLGRRRAEHAGLVRLFESLGRPAAEIFFVDLPGANRVHGREDLVYDPWLYPVFESIGLAEPRSRWLERALSSGAVRVVAATTSRPQIDGLSRTLPELGYAALKRVGPYFVWARQTREGGRD